MLKRFSNKQLQSVLKSTNNFSTNCRIMLTDNHKQVYDENLKNYPPIISALVLKRRITRKQIWPKIYILDETPKQQERHLNYQKLYNLKKVLSEKQLTQFAKSQASINSAYIISLFSEDYFKQMIDEYVGKVLVSGKCSQTTQQLQIQKRAKQLYRIYYYGENITPLQRQLQLQYLMKKQQKFIKYQSTFKKGKRNQYLRCLWRVQDQRILEQFSNWRAVDQKYSDENLRPCFLKMDLPKRYQNILLVHKQIIKQDNFVSQYFHMGNIKSSLTQFHLVNQYCYNKIFTRIMLWTKSPQFNNTLQIPADFLIQMSIIYTHCWMVANRLRQFNTKSSNFVAQKLEEQIKRIMQNITGTLNVKKKGLLDKDIGRMIDQNTRLFHIHFNIAEKTKKNPYIGIDSLVWSCIFTEKIQRYSQAVYLFGQYFIKNHQHLQQHTQEQMLNAILQFDVFLIDYNYRHKIQALNPPLTKEQFQLQMKKKGKAIRGTYKSILKDVQLPLYSNDAMKSRRRLAIEKTINYVMRILSKFRNIKYYDHFNKMEEDLEKKQQREKKSPWTQTVEDSKNVEKQFEDLQNLRGKTTKVKSINQDKK